MKTNFNVNNIWMCPTDDFTSKNLNEFHFKIDQYGYACHDTNIVTRYLIKTLSR